MTTTDSRRRPAPGPSAPRNFAAAERARERDQLLFVSFVGDLPFGEATVYADAGQRYDWRCLQGLQTVVCVRPVLQCGRSGGRSHRPLVA